MSNELEDTADYFDETENATRSINACLECRRRKARCTMEIAACSRCLSTGVECYYPPSTTNQINFVQVFSQRLGQFTRRVRELEDKLKDSVGHLLVSGILPSTQLKLEGLPQGWSVANTHKNILRIDTGVSSISDLLRAVKKLGESGSKWGGEPVIRDVYLFKDDAFRAFKTRLIWRYGLISDNSLRKQRCSSPQLTNDLAYPLEFEKQFPKTLLLHLAVSFCDCFFPYRILNRQRFLWEFQNATLDQLLRYSSMAWSARHELRRGVKDARLKVISEYAFRHAKHLASEHFDNATLSVVISFMAMHICSLYEGEKSNYLYLARQHLEQPINTALYDNNLPYVDEVYRRASHGVMFLEGCNIIFGNFANWWLPSNWEPGQISRLPHENPVVAVHGSVITQLVKMIRQLLLLGGRREREEEGFAREAWRLLSRLHEHRPSELRESGNDPQCFALRSSYETIYLSLLIRIGLPVSEGCEEEKPGDNERRELCMKGACRIVELVSKVIELDAQCLVWDLIGVLSVAYDALIWLIQDPSFPHERIPEALWHLLWILRILPCVNTLGIEQHTRELTEKVHISLEQLKSIIANYGW
ncbi:uncharacterized protein VTP21DRAFT_8922 [Calcarisporiella thermophila]|uniref:uncharacterized protein n=1 Tax=Calcarisporiella thermophila TaxID=911321 RepID=UPI0037432BA9